ncbi:MAG TPA: 5'-methylthioadenosine/S-adenosylhomocysteine nucleosidase [Nitrolancea sp.]|nr:5'-methylthioadenosine/S-adenosylhomocysteine nucleosidase [Nitrolancea sp.]
MNDSREPFALICAMESERSHALQPLSDPTQFPLGPWCAYRGRLAGHPVVVLSTGIGLVNAAAATSVLLSQVHPRAVFNYGCAGAHHEEIFPGDVVIGSEVVAYGSLITLPDGSERYAGFRYNLNGQTFLTDQIRADRELLARARDAAGGWEPPAWPVVGKQNRAPVVHTGVIASADCWTQNAHRIGVLHDRHRSLCEEMEAAAVAQVCAMYDVPMLAIKDISNNELHSATEHGASGPTLAEVSCELGARSFELVERVISSFDC